MNRIFDTFEAANPDIEVDLQFTPDADYQNRLSTALRGGKGPDIAQLKAYGELQPLVEAGYLDALNDLVPALADMPATATGGVTAVSDGKFYGVPYSVPVLGVFYNTEIFAQNGIEVPKTYAEFTAAADKLKAAGITPIAVGAGDKWPSAHYWYNFALKSCSPEVLQEAQVSYTFDDPCFLEAGNLLQDFIASNPFQEGFLGTSAQQGAGSSAGMLATGNAAMELMGHWNPGVMGGILQEETGDAAATPPEFLGWFNFPGIDGAKGDPTAALGGGDGFSCSAWAPPECVELLKYISSVDVQTRFAEQGAGIPVTPGAEAGLADVNLKQVLAGLQASSYVQLWLDTAYGPTVGGAMNEGIVNLFGGAGSPEDIVKGMKDAAATL